MSGIAGIIRFDGGPIDPGLVRRMTNSMAHRGPDGIHHWTRGSVALGHCMLRTTPESLEEYQPLTNEDESLALVMHGTVDNWEELRNDLLSRGARLRTRADAELVLRAYEIWAEDCLAHIDGDFALAIWNHNKRELFAARDRIGHKPFNFYFDGKILAFASELQAILQLPWVRQIPNEGMIAEIISDEWMSRDETIWTGIHRIIAAHWIAFYAEGSRSACYWQPDISKPLAYKRDEDYFEHYRTLLVDIVRRQSRSHQPVACEVSGGLDSSAIFCIGEQLRQEARLPAPGLSGYTLAFQDDPTANEVSYARAVGEHVSLAITELAPASHGIEWYADIARKYRDIPGFPNGASGTSLLQAASNNGHRVVLSGAGGDHFLTGSLAYYFEELTQGNVIAFGQCFAEDVRQIGIKRSLGRLFRYGLAPLAPRPIRELLRPQLRAWAGETKRGAYWLSRPLQEILKARRETFKSQASPAWSRRGQIGLLQNLSYPYDAFARDVGERLLAHQAIDYRVPFYTREFIEFAFVTPDRLRSTGDRIKIIHRESLKGLLPETVRLRHTKASFSGTFDERLQSLRDHFTEALPRIHSKWLDEDGMKRLWAVYCDHPDSGWQCWALWACLTIDMVVTSETT